MSKEMSAEIHRFKYMPFVIGNAVQGFTQINRITEMLYESCPPQHITRYEPGMYILTRPDDSYIEKMYVSEEGKIRYTKQFPGSGNIYAADLHTSGQKLPRITPEKTGSIPVGDLLTGTQYIDFSYRRFQDVIVLNEGETGE